MKQCQKINIIYFTIIICFIFNINETFAKGEIYSDKDWNVKFFNGCGFPSENGKKQNLKILNEIDNKFLRFFLYNQQIGTCGSVDRKPRNKAPYWERAELSQLGKLNKNEKYDISFHFRLIQGFTNKSENIFQIHGYNTPKCSKPILMLKFVGKYNKHLTLYLVTFQKNKNDIKSNYSRKWNKHTLYKNDGNKIYSKDILNIWNEIQFIVDFQGSKGTLDVMFNKNKIEHKLNFNVMKCQKPHLKFGIYRPGNKKKNGNVLSIIDFDKFKINISKT